MKKILALLIGMVLIFSCGCSFVGYDSIMHKSNKSESSDTSKKTDKKSEYKNNDKSSDINTDDILEKKEDARENLLAKMSDSEKKDINTFFSNFSESYFENYNHLLIDDKSVIDFAYVHVIVNRKNNSGVFNSNGNTYIPLSIVNEVADKYLGIKLSGKSADYWTFDGTNYYRQEANGESYDMFSVVNSLYDLGDGTYKAELNSYYAGYECMDQKYYSYTDSMAKSECEFKYSSEAVIRRKNYNDESTWELISLVKI